MNHPIVDRRRVTAVLSLVSAVLLAACQAGPLIKPLPEQPRVFGLHKTHVFSFKDLAPGMTLLCPGNGECKLQELGPDFSKILIENPRRVFLTCLADAQIPCERLTSPSGFNQCSLPQVAADLERLQREAARKCAGFVQVP